MASRTPQTAPNGQIQKRDKDPATELRGLIKRMEPQIKNAVPRQMGVERFLRATMTAVTKEPKLALCTPGSFFICLLTTAQLGLMPSMAGGVWLVPFKKGRVLECTAIIDYRGLCVLARRSGLVTDIAGEVVYAGDDFYYELGTNRHIRHIPDLTNPERHTRPISWAYGTAQVRGDTTPMFRVLSRAEVIKRRDVNRGSDSDFSPWKNWEEEMFKKTAVRQVLKLAPADTEDQLLTRAMAVEDARRPVELIDAQIADAIQRHGIEVSEPDTPAEPSTPTSGLTPEEIAAGWELSPDGEMIPPPAKEGGAA